MSEKIVLFDLNRILNFKDNKLEIVHLFFDKRPIDFYYYISYNKISITVYNEAGLRRIRCLTLYKESDQYYVLCKKKSIVCKQLKKDIKDRILQRYFCDIKLNNKSEWVVLNKIQNKLISSLFKLLITIRSKNNDDIYEIQNKKLFVYKRYDGDGLLTVQISIYTVLIRYDIFIIQTEKGDYDSFGSKMFTKGNVLDWVLRKTLLALLAKQI